MNSMWKRMWEWRPQLAWTAFNGFRVPPEHLPEETRQAMIKAIWRAQIRSPKYWLALLGVMAGPVPIWVAFTFFEFQHIRSPHQIMIMTFSMLVATMIFEVGLVILVIKPLNSGIVARIWREQRICSVCGYDCRLSSERCPECGTAI